GVCSWVSPVGSGRRGWMTLHPSTVTGMSRWMKSHPPYAVGLKLLLSDDSALAQALALFVGETEAGQHVVGVFAQLWAAMADASRRARELGQHARYFQRAGESLDLLDHLPRQVVRVLDDVGGGVGIAGRHAGALERFDHLVAVVLCGPLANGRVDQLGVLRAAVVVGEARVVGQVRA